MISVNPPGALGTMTVTGRAGHLACARAGSAVVAAANAMANSAQLIIRREGWKFQCMKPITCGAERCSDASITGARLPAANRWGSPDRDRLLLLSREQGLRGRRTAGQAPSHSRSM